jgi:hypothetical protein
MSFCPFHQWPNMSLRGSPGPASQMFNPESTTAHAWLGHNHTSGEDVEPSSICMQPHMTSGRASGTRYYMTPSGWLEDTAKNRVFETCWLNYVWTVTKQVLYYLTALVFCRINRHQGSRSPVTWQTHILFCLFQAPPERAHREDTTGRALCEVLNDANPFKFFFDV